MDVAKKTRIKALLEKAEAGSARAREAQQVAMQPGSRLLLQKRLETGKALSL